MLDLFLRHQARLEQAVEANRRRTGFAPFVESPSARFHPPGAQEAGLAAFQARLHKPFALHQPASSGWVGNEVSPLSGESLGIVYPRVQIPALLDAMAEVSSPWARATPRERVGVCLEILQRWADNTFENAYATQHTAGQGFILAFAGSGASSLERGLEALAMAHWAMEQVPSTAQMARRFGGRADVVLDKRYQVRPVGIAAVVSCGSYPAWNAWPAILANLATGNPVVVKPHPNGILPVAIAVAQAREVLAEVGMSPNLVCLAADDAAHPVTQELLCHPRVRLIDFTGSQAFGAWIERNCADKQVYTETSGCNAVVVASAEDLDAVADAIAESLCLFSAQMCTAAQNIWVPADGIETPGGLVSVDGFCRRLREAVERRIDDPSRAVALCGAIQNPSVVANIASLRQLAKERGLSYVIDSRPLVDAAYPRTASPLVVRCQPEHTELYQQEWFGPMGFVISAPSVAACIAGAAADAGRFGSIANYGYAVDEEVQEQMVEAFWEAGASIGLNLIGQRPINFTAAFSDFHVTGLNPAGSATLTDLGFVAGRFRVVQAKRERR